MPAKITEQAKLTCDKGTAPAQLKVTSQNFCKADNKLIATEMDKQANINIPAFGSCSITQKDCQPMPTSWLNATIKDSINELKILTEASFCNCSQGGKISVIHKGYSEIHDVS